MRIRVKLTYSSSVYYNFKFNRSEETSFCHRFLEMKFLATKQYLVSLKLLLFAVIPFYYAFLCLILVLAVAACKTASSWKRKDFKKYKEVPKRKSKSFLFG